MKKTLLLILTLGALAGCGDGYQKPFVGCVSEGPEQIGRGRYGDYTYRECNRKALKCLEPLHLAEADDELICKLENK